MRSNSLARAKPLLGTLVEIKLGGASHPRLFEASSEAFRVIEKVHHLMSFHDPQSDVSQMNRFAFQREVTVHPWTSRVLKMAQRIAAKTKGHFDVTIAPWLVRMGYLPQQSFLALESTEKSASFRDIELLPSSRIRFRRPLIIDLGGIAKGFAVDQAVRLLKRRGISQGVVNAGGDLRVFGKFHEPIYVRRPDCPGQFFFLGCFRETSVATSAAYFARKRWKSQWVTPIVRPLTGRPCQVELSVSVVADSCTTADALTKVVMNQWNRSEDFLKSFSARAVILRKAHASRCEAPHAS